MSVVNGLLKMSFWIPKKVRFAGNRQKGPNKYENTQVPLDYIRTGKTILVQWTLQCIFNLRSLKSSLDSLK